MAGQFAVAAGDRFYRLKVGHGETYRRLAADHLLLDHLLRKIADDPAIRFADLVSDAAWHPSWKPVPRPVLVHHVF